ncbi:hypothetical protein [Patiriisocius sp. Uisw_017]|uniref:hypothetical protein n=1 Tax=Patiriisocius sp. Uisw_017 TaxID=3230968 RepID=UPI0039E8C222
MLNTLKKEVLSFGSLISEFEFTDSEYMTISDFSNNVSIDSTLLVTDNLKSSKAPLTPTLFVNL